ncbi:NAD(P)H-binding protein [Chromatocurvus halotolerans]|uniref:Divinyl chlorophyllide a 8-vinyl-reductase, chloroplastic n=1 Tax=Chromatocurvus halotolerans TaxID=1132028 RepID=A0A4V2SC24_9GAMM|nr:NAD(P)H-binding protein [Chromatocurvus halotolerans]TCO77750.1 divinylchlorophyllide 8-vinylreductase [Chromatocurvus halotolerans]
MNHRVLVAGASGYIGRQLVAELLTRGCEVTCLLRTSPDAGTLPELAGAVLRVVDFTSSDSISRQGIDGDAFDAVYSCLATRGGGIRDAWHVEYQCNHHLLTAARAADIPHFVLLSAICVQTPKLAFQHAKLAFEQELLSSGLRYSIVRPTAFFKSLSGQIRRIQQGKSFLVFGDGEQTACKPISERDLAMFLANCLQDDGAHNAILPVGGPGPAITPLQQGEMLFRIYEKAPRYTHVPVQLFSVVGAVLWPFAKLSSAAADKAEFARIGRFYATESMLSIDPETGRHSAEATPSFGGDTLEAFYQRTRHQGLAGQELGEHALF